MNKNEIAIVFGKFNPAHRGHLALYNHLRDFAEKQGIGHRVYTGTSHFKNAKAKNPKVDPKTPLHPELKLKHLKRVLGTENVHIHSNPFGAIEDLLGSGHSRVHIVLGTDRIDDQTAQKLKDQFGDRVNVVAGPKRDAESSDFTAKASSTLLRRHATENKFEDFANLLPEHMPEDHVREYFNDVRQGLSKAGEKLHENSHNSILSSFFKNYLIEKKETVKREPLTGEKKLKRRRQNRNNQRNKRTKDGNAVEMGDIRGKVLGVKDDKGRFLIISKRSYNPNKHTKVVDPERASRGSLEKFLNDDKFVNTDTSQKLFGFKEKQKGGGKKEKATKEETSSPKKKKEKQKTQGTSREEEQSTPSIVASKKASKKDTFATTHGATEMESGILFTFNTMLGLTPEQMVSQGLIDKKDLDAVMKNQHQSFMPSCQRAAQQLLEQFGPGVYIKHTGRLKKETKLSPEAITEGVVDTTPKSDLVVVDKNGKVVAGLSQKIGDSQLASGGPSESMANFKYAARVLGDKLDPKLAKKLKNLEKIFREDLGGNPRTGQGPVSLYQMGGEREGKDKEVARREDLHEKATELVNDILNSDEDFAAAFIYSLITGSGKFEQGSAAIASHVFSANRDGTDAKISVADMNYANKLVGKIKIQMKFKSSAVETTDVRKKWDDFKKHKASIGEKVKAEDDFRPYSFRSVIRAYLMTEGFRFSGSRLARILIENTSKKELEILVQEPKNAEEAMK